MPTHPQGVINFITFFLGNVVLFYFSLLQPINASSFVAFGFNLSQLLVFDELTQLVLGLTWGLKLSMFATFSVSFVKFWWDWYNVLK